MRLHPLTAAIILALQARLARWSLLGLLFLLTACSAFRPKTEIKVDPCAPWSPIIPSLEDRLTDQTAEQILIHDCIGWRLGCWKPENIEQACQALPLADPAKGARTP